MGWKKVTFIFTIVAIIIAAIIVLILHFTGNLSKIKYNTEGGQLNKPPRLFLPLYIYPSNVIAYERAGKAMLDLDGNMDIIINPTNGEDSKKQPNSDWVRGLDALKSAAGSYWSESNIYGYVYTLYGKRDISAVKADIKGYITNGWNKWMSGGIFIDEVPTTNDKLAYYQELVNYTKSLNPKLKVILNPGQTTTSEYESMADSIMSYETSSNLLATYKPSSLQLNGSNKNKFIAIILPVEKDPAVLLGTLSNFKFGRLYITKTFTSLPVYFDELVNKLKK